MASRHRLRHPVLTWYLADWVVWLVGYGLLWWILP